MHKKILHPAAPDFQLKRKKEKEERRKKKDGGRGLAILPAVGLRLFFFFSCFSGRGSRRPTVFFFFLTMGLAASPSSSLAVALPRHLTVTHLATSRRPVTETHGWVSPAVGLVFS
jgi:hypothetical protein